MADEIIDLAKLDEEPYLVADRNTILLPTDGRFDRLIPDNTPVMEIKGHAYYAVPNSPEFSAMLYQHGYPMPSPIYYSDYDWSGVKIFAAQAQMAGLLSARRRAFNLSALGTGKTIGSLLAVDYLIAEGRVRKALIAAPLSVLWTVWDDEIKHHFPKLRSVIVHGTHAQRRKLLCSPHWNVAIINHDGIKVVLPDLLTQNFEMIVIDEVAMYRDHTTEKWAAMQKVVNRATFAAGLTGSPTPNYPSDAYGIARLLVPERCPRSFHAFRISVELKVNDFRWVPRNNAAEIVSRILQPAVRFKRSDVSELRDMKGVKVQSRRVLLSDMQQEALAALKKEAIARFPEGIVKAVNAAVLVNKVLQICGGAVYTTSKTDRQIINLDPKQRIDTVRELIRSADSKVIVVSPYLHHIDMLVDELCGEFKIARLVGDIDPRARAELVRRFRDKTNPLHVIAAHPKPLAHGLNLTSANTIIWYTPIHSRELYEQVNGRITRLGQDLEQFIMHLTSGKDENYVYDVLEGRGRMLGAVLSMFELRMKGDITDEYYEDTPFDLGI